MANQTPPTLRAAIEDKPSLRECARRLAIAVETAGRSYTSLHVEVAQADWADIAEASTALTAALALPDAGEGEPYRSALFEVMARLVPAIADAAIVGETFGIPEILAVVDEAVRQLKATPADTPPTPSDGTSYRDRLATDKEYDAALRHWERADTPPALMADELERLARLADDRSVIHSARSSKADATLESQYQALAAKCRALAEPETPKSLVAGPMPLKKGGPGISPEPKRCAEPEPGR